MKKFDVTELNQVFQVAFGSVPRIFRSPGRINLIGEHTDYNDGYVLPAAIGSSVYVAIALRNDNAIRMRSLDMADAYVGDIAELSRSETPWVNYILGVLYGFSHKGAALQGFDVFIGSDLPVGAGLSSSAALCCAAAYAFNEAFHVGLSRMEMAQIAQQSEHLYAGVKCGIMDPFASLFGKKDSFIRLDCRSLEYEYVSLDMEGISILLFDTNVKHSLASTAYNKRREECQLGVTWVQETWPEVHSLRDVTEEMLRLQVAPKDEMIYRRCLYVVQENQRLISLCSDLAAGDLAEAGRKMFQTHAGLRDLYEVSCPEADYLVDLAQAQAVILGARMMGGGFGGCTINIMKTDAVVSVTRSFEESYERRFGQGLNWYQVHLSDGTGECVK